MNRFDRVASQIERRDGAHSDRNDPPMRLAHVLFVLWVAASVAWALFAAMFAHDHGWLVQHPLAVVAAVLIPSILAHLLAILIVKRTKNPRMRW